MFGLWVLIEIAFCPKIFGVVFFAFVFPASFTGAGGVGGAAQKGRPGIELAGDVANDHAHAIDVVGIGVARAIADVSEPLSGGIVGGDVQALLKLPARI